MIDVWCCETKSNSNKKCVLEFYEQVFNRWDLSSLDAFMRDDYIQHSPEVGDGKQGFLKFITGFIQQRPHAEIIKVLEDDDLVCVFFRCTMGNGTIVKLFDLYRLENGMLAEHWDCTMDIATIPVQNRNGHF